MFANLRLQIVNRASYLLKNSSLKRHIFDYVHFPAHFFLFPFVADETGTGARKEALWILAKEKNAGCTNFLLSIYFCHKIIVLSKKLHARLSIANDTHVIIDEVHVYIIHRGTKNILVFVVAFPFVIEKLHALIEAKFLTFVTYTHKTLVSLIGMKLAACRNMHKQNAILLTTMVRARQILALHFDRRIAEVERNAKQLIQSFLIPINAFHTSCFVRNTNSKYATICISHSHNGYCQCFGVNLNALTVECLRFLACLYFFYCHHLN